MTQTKLERRMVTNEEFKQARANEDNIKVINKVLSRFYKVIPPQDLQICADDALWRCLGYHQKDKGNKFTTSLWRFTLWECQRTLKRIRREANRHTINISAIETKEKFEVPMRTDNPDIKHMIECIELLKPDEKQLIQQYYFDRYTMEEIGNIHGYSKEAARQKINKAVQELRKRCIDGV